jgi:hypothetical protein
MAEGAVGRSAVLVIEADGSERERFGTWLEEGGFQVLVCPGPTEPDYTCVGARGGVCPLLEEAGLVVIDMSLDSEAVMTGTAAEELLGLYLLSGRPVLVLGSHAGEQVPGQLMRMHRHPSQPELVDAVRILAGGPIHGAGSEGP